MSDGDYVEWVEKLEKRASTLGLIFLQLGAVHESARVALKARLDVVEVREFMESSNLPISSILVIDGVERLIRVRSDLTMGMLRERVHEYMVTDRHRFVLLSRSPRAAFPAVPGSSLIDDAALFGSPHIDGAAPDKWTSGGGDTADSTHILRRALEELGPEVCASLDRAIFDSLLVGQVALRILSARELEALDGAGITCVKGEIRDWNLPANLEVLKEELANVLADEVYAQTQLFQVTRGLWEIERRIRRAVRSRAIIAWGDEWRSRCLNGDLPQEVLKRANSSACPGVRSIKALRDPLEWLTLGELLGLRTRGEIGDLGMASPIWRQFEDKIMPIRNRLAHMRTLYPGDETEVIKWREVIQRRI